MGGQRPGLRALQVHTLREEGGVAEGGWCGGGRVSGLKGGGAMGTHMRFP